MTAHTGKKIRLVPEIIPAGEFPVYEWGSAYEDGTSGGNFSKPNEKPDFLDAIDLIELQTAVTRHDRPGWQLYVVAWNPDENLVGCQPVNTIAGGLVVVES